MFVASWFIFLSPLLSFLLHRGVSPKALRRNDQSIEGISNKLLTVGKEKNDSLVDNENETVGLLKKSATSVCGSQKTGYSGAAEKVPALPRPKKMRRSEDTEVRL